jgi:hypothetical protein
MRFRILLLIKVMRVCYYWAIQILQAFILSVLGTPRLYF